jgi:hypothetical protein
MYLILGAGGQVAARAPTAILKMQQPAGGRRWGIRTAQLAKRTRLPRPHGDQQARAEALRER